MEYAIWDSVSDEISPAKAFTAGMDLFRTEFPNSEYLCVTHMIPGSDSLVLHGVFGERDNMQFRMAVTLDGGEPNMVLLASLDNNPPLR